MSEALDILLQASFWAATLRIATPLIFATLGELICERAGMINLGIEGIMTMGAMVGWLAVYQGADLWTGVLLAALAGMAMGLLLGLLTVPLGLSQHVTGIGITLLATSASYYTYRVLLPNVSTPPRIEPYKTHLAYVKERRSDADGEAILEEALTKLRNERAAIQAAMERARN